MNLPIYHFLTAHADSIKTVIEAGAHKGRDTVKLATKLPLASIHAFEPVPELFEQLTSRTSHIPSVHRYPYALSNKSGNQTIHISGGRSDACSSLLEPTDLIKKPAQVYHEPVTFEQNLTISVTTLQEWAAQRNIHKIDFIWLDAQGSELAILQGAKDLLTNVFAAYVEVNLVERYRGAPTEQELIDYCAQFGLVCSDRDQPKHGKRNLLFTAS